MHKLTLKRLFYQYIDQLKINVLDKVINVLRQITAGVNAGLRVSNMRSFLPYEYRCLDNIPFIESVIIHPPFITYSKRNKRDGVFPEIKAQSN